MEPERSLTHRYKLVPVTDIIVQRDARQRRVIDTSNLKDSIARVGVLQPVIVTKGLVLVAGERRLAASRELGLREIPVRFAEDLPPLEAQIIELEENLKRQDLGWKDQVLAVARIHDLYSLANGSDWTQARTAQAIGISAAFMTSAIRVARDIDSPRIVQAASWAAAYNILSRLDERHAGDALSEIIEAGDSALSALGGPPVGTVATAPGDAVEGPSSGALPMPGDGPDAPATPVAGAPLPPPPPSGTVPRLSPDDTILLADFSEWVDTYSGPRFNFIHCDFPYGIEAFAGPMAGRDKWTQYSDSADTYWKLLGTLCHNLDRLMAHSGHLMFWFSMEHYTKTLQYFTSHAPDLDVQVFPLVWVKSDNVGVLPDARRGPRRVYETALIGTRNDRPVAKPVANAYAAPTDKQHHQSTKPEPVLRHFFQMFVDSSTRMLDPTCGGGSAIRAAESMGAKQCLGLEISEEHCTSARSALRSFRALKRASEAA